MIEIEHTPRRKSERIGFVGLGNMGGPMAANIISSGHDLTVFDVAGTAARAPDGAVIASSVGDVARQTSLVLLSLPDMQASRSVVAEIADSGMARGGIVADTSTVGPAAARAAHARLAAAGIDYVDAPVSGQALKAADGTLTVMFSGSAEAFERLRPAFDAIAANVFELGKKAGQGQLMKLVNNYLSIASFVTVSEALACGERAGLSMGDMLDVINASTGQCFSTSQTFPKHVLTETYDMNGASAILKKDMALYLDSAKGVDAPRYLANAAMDVVTAFAQTDAEADQAAIYPFIRDGGFEA